MLEAGNGQATLDILKIYREKISIILLDVMMPVMDGYTFLEQIKKEPELSLIPVIVMTQSGNEEDGPTAPNPTELLDTARFHSMIESMRKVYDYVIVDCPPLGLVIDAAVVARECDGAIIVVEAGKVKYRLVQSVKEQLEYAKIPILGVVLNKIERKKNPGYYNKYYGKGYKKGGYNTYYSSETQKK